MAVKTSKNAVFGQFYTFINNGGGNKGLSNISVHMNELVVISS
jgi:hypothetical protein